MRVPSFTFRSLARAAALTAALGTAACTDPYGRTDWGSTLALGAGIGLAAGAVAALASDHQRQPHGRDLGYSRSGPRYAQAHGGWR